MDVIKQFEPLFGEWHVESFIGAGSFGRVYKIYRDELNNRFYSALKYISIPSEENEVKQLRADGMDDASISTYYGSLAENVSQEITLMNRLKGNTNVISFEDSRVIPKPGGVGYDIFIRMELLESLTNRTVEHPLSTEEVVKLGLNICSALKLCAKNSIIHRDIKPDNIFISPNGDYKLGDFGIARHLESAATFMSKKGTYTYMAPEVYKGEKYGATCDIYSLGLVMYRLLNGGRLPFLPPAPQPIGPEDRENSIIRRMKGEALSMPASADPQLGRIVLKACAFKPEDRYQIAEDMYRDLYLYSTCRQGADTPESFEAFSSAASRVSNNVSPESYRVRQPQPEEPKEVMPKVVKSRMIRPEQKNEQKNELQQETTPQTQMPRMVRSERSTDRIEPEPKNKPEENPDLCPPTELREKQPHESVPQTIRVQNPDDDSDEAAELKQMIGYFSQKTAQYRQYDALARQVAAKPKNNPLFLILGIVMSVIGLLLFGVLGVNISDSVMGFGAVLIVLSPGLILLYVFKNKAERNKYQKTIEQFDKTAEELYRHYTEYGACSIGPEYTNPANLKVILSMILTGKANDICTAIDLLNRQAGQRKPVFVKAYKSALAWNAERKASVPCVFLPEAMYRFQ